MYCCKLHTCKKWTAAAYQQKCLQDQNLVFNLFSREMISSLVFIHAGLPSYKCFIAFVEYLQPKAVALTPAWNGRNTKEVSKKETQLISQTFARLPVADQLFFMLIRLRCGLDALDVCSLQFQ